MMQPVVSHRVRANQQLESEHSTSEILKGERPHAFAGFSLLLSDTLGDAEQEGAGARGWVENRDGGITQAFGMQVVA